MIGYFNTDDGGSYLVLQTLDRGARNHHGVITVLAHDHAVYQEVLEVFLTPRRSLPRGLILPVLVATFIWCRAR